MSNKYIDVWKFHKSTIVDMKKLIKETKLDGNERAALLCADFNNKLTLQSKCIGDNCSIKKYEKSSCDGKNIKVGTFHTHPKGNDLNLHDIQKARERLERVQCIGKVPNEKIECFVDKENSSEFYEDLSKEKPTLDSFVKRGHEVQECIELVDKNMPILKAYTDDYIKRNLVKIDIK